MRESRCDYRGVLGSCHSLYCPVHGIPVPKKQALITAHDKETEIFRVIIQRDGYRVARYKGHYYQVLGGIRGALFLGSVPTGKC